MKGPSFNQFPSLEDIPIISNHYSGPSLRLIMSEYSISSQKEIENKPLNEFLIFQEEQNVSIDFHHQDEPAEHPKESPVATQEYVETPIKKSKTGCVCKKTGCIKLYCECFRNVKLCTE